MIADTTIGTPCYSGVTVGRIVGHIRNASTVTTGNGRLESMVQFSTPDGNRRRLGIFFLTIIDEPGMKLLRELEEKVRAANKEMYCGMLDAETIKSAK